MEKKTRWTISSDIHYLMESIAFGLTDGVICFLGIVVGVARATSSPTFVMIAGIIAGIADALGNSIGFYISQETERAVQLRGSEKGENLHIHSKREVLMSGVFSFIATLLVLVLLLFPFVFFSVWTATVISFLIGTVSAFCLGVYIGKLSDEDPLKCGLKYSSITIAGALISYGIGEVLSAYLY